MSGTGRMTVLRRNWREVLLALVVALPWLCLVALGGVWLWQGGHVLAWAAGAVVLGLLAWPLRRAVRRRAQAEARLALRADPAPAWTASERAAWDQVLAVADAAEPLSFTERDPLVALARQTVETVARHFHADASDAWARFTLPEALLLAERVARDLRRQALRHIPGVREVRLDHLLWTQRVYDRYGAALGWAGRIGYGLWRGTRLVLNPLQAVVQEARDVLMDQTSGVLSARMRAHATRLIVLEVGRAAIDLYAGRLSLSDDELEAARARDLDGADASPVGPVRILLAGQVNAGKSSLVNALARAARCAVGPVPTTNGAVDYLLTVEGRPPVVLVDMPGLVGGADAGRALAAQAGRADLVLWVAAATQPARAIDRAGLDALRAAIGGQLARRPPPILLALTHVDLLRPAGEWAPPYDVNTPATAKARTMRAAMEAVAGELALPLNALVPVALAGEPYNIDALWARIALELGEAQLVQADRLRQGGASLAARVAPFTQAGRWILQAVVKG